MSADVDREIAASAEVSRRRRRRWSAAEKRRIVEESLEPGVSVSIVARRHDVNANQVFTWRRELREQRGCAADERFVPMVVTAADAALGAAPGAARPDAGRMEIVLVGGRRVIVGPDVDGAALARVVAVLERRAVRRSPEGEGG
jgi:transposase